jgi:hypothetical protein
MHVRIVRFTDVTSQRMAELQRRLEESDAPPPDSHVKAVKVFVDHEQGTAVVFQEFESGEDLAAGEKFFGAMDTGDTPGTRASVDRCELAAERHV